MNGREDPHTGLKPRELLGLIVVANLANYLSGDTWIVGSLIDKNGSLLSGDVAHDGLILCSGGAKKGQYIRFEQVMATDKDTRSNLTKIEEAVINQIKNKDSRGKGYGVDEMGLIVFVDYEGEISDLYKLSSEIYSLSYRLIYLVAKISKKNNHYACIVLKNPENKLGAYSVEFNSPDGSAEVSVLS